MQIFRRHLGLETAFVHGAHASQVHASMGNGARLVEDHGADLARNGNPANVQTADVFLLQPQSSSTLAQREGDRHHGIHRLRQEGNPYEETIDPSLSLEGHRGDETNRCPQRHKCIDHWQLLSVFELHQSWIENHSDQSPLGGPSPDGDHHGQRQRRAAVGVAGFVGHALEHFGACKETVLLAVRLIVEQCLRILLQRHLLQGHGLACQHTLVDHRTASHQRQVSTDHAVLDLHHIAQGQVRGRHVLPLSITQYLLQAMSSRGGHLSDLLLISTQDHQAGPSTTAKDQKNPQQCNVPGVKEEVAPDAHHLKDIDRLRILRQ
mmetsp:Transcript_44068/g.89973  ORF Transcript_44068/g.89973 Transcript_44068/m.89973 type:complete len:321 (-) Transcript_44068:98-1060(-)